LFPLDVLAKSTAVWLFPVQHLATPAQGHLSTLRSNTRVD